MEIVGECPMIKGSYSLGKGEPVLGMEFSIYMWCVRVLGPGPGCRPPVPAHPTMKLGGEGATSH